MSHFCVCFILFAVLFVLEDHFISRSRPTLLQHFREDTHAFVLGGAYQSAKHCYGALL